MAAKIISNSRRNKFLLPAPPSLRQFTFMTIFVIISMTTISLFSFDVKICYNCRTNNTTVMDNDRTRTVHLHHSKRQ